MTSRLECEADTMGFENTEVFCECHIQRRRASRCGHVTFYTEATREGRGR